jgi:copper homeostasis protein
MGALLARLKVEIVVASAADARAAHAGGAARLELVTGLDLGGLTPSAGLIHAVMEATPLPVMAMLRPRQSGMVYDADDIDTMRRDARYLAQVGCPGAVFGVLTPQRDIDRDAMARVMEAAPDLEWVCHRAFDIVRNPAQALEDLISLGVRRVLTSGGRASWLDGTEQLRSLVAQAQGRIEVMVCGGVRAENIAQISGLTGSTLAHLAPLAPGIDPGIPETDLTFGRPEPRPEAEYPVVRAEDVSAVVEAAL